MVDDDDDSLRSNAKGFLALFLLIGTIIVLFSFMAAGN